MQPPDDLLPQIGQEGTSTYELTKGAPGISSVSTLETSLFDITFSWRRIDVSDPVHGNAPSNPVSSELSQKNCAA